MCCFALVVDYTTQTGVVLYIANITLQCCLILCMICFRCPEGYSGSLCESLFFLQDNRSGDI